MESLLPRDGRWVVESERSVCVVPWECAISPSFLNAVSESTRAVKAGRSRSPMWRTVYR